MIVRTDYKELVKFIHPELVEVSRVPLFDNFLMTGKIKYSDRQMLGRFKNCIVLSDYMADEEWGREDIVNLVLKKINSRRKPSYADMGSVEFVDRVKLLYASGMWEDPGDGSGVFELFKNMDSYKRVKEYYKLRESGLHPLVIMSSVLTFVNKCFDDDIKFVVKGGYLRIIERVSGMVRSNFKKAIEKYSVSGLDDDMRVLLFIIDLGGKL